MFLLPPAPWMRKAACQDAEFDVFFADGQPTQTDRVAEAKAICRSCLVAYDCLRYALRNDEKYGIWGGATPRERTIITRRESRRTA